MTTLDEPQDQAAEPAMLPTDPVALLRTLATSAGRLDEHGQPLPFAAGTVAFYPTPNGGVYIVANLVEGAPEILGEHRGEIPSGMIRAAGALMGGGPIARVRGMLGRRGQN